MKLIRLLLIPIMLAGLFIFIEPGESAKSMEVTTFTVNVTTGLTNTEVITAYNKGGAFSDCRNADVGNTESTYVGRAGVKYEHIYDWWIWETFQRFNLSGLPPDVEIVEIRVVFKPLLIDDTGDWGAEHYYSFFACDTATVMSPVLTDYGHIYQDGFPIDIIAGPFGQGSCSVGVERSLEVRECDWEFFTDNPAGNDIYLDFESEYQRLNWQPGDAIDGAKVQMQLSEMSIQIDYVAVAEERTMTDSDDSEYHENDDVDTTILGSEVADNITWNTPRCLYSDEYPEIWVNGDSGANITLKLYDVDGAVLSSQSDSIRVDGIYAWQINDIASDYEGFIRVRELNFGLTSKWGYISASPDGSQKTNRIYAEYTEYPQYDISFNDYVVQKGDYLFWHWKTNLDGSTELPYYNVEVWNRGDNTTTPLYDETLSDMAANYYYGSEVFNQDNLHWRYMILTPGYTTGQDSYNGLVRNLGIPFDTSHKGFIQAAITDNASAELTETHSAYWYLSNANEGIGITSKYGNYAVDDSIIIGVVIGDECNVEYDLPSLEIEMIYGDEIVQTYYFSIVEGDNEFTMLGFDTEGSYIARCKFYSNIKTFAYVKDVHFTISGETSGTPYDEDIGPAGVGDWITYFKELIARWGLDNEGGHWLIILILVLIVAIAFRAMPLVATGIIILLIVGAMIFKWINPWFIVLLSLGAGVFIYSWIRRSRKTQV